jgi:hypothetical protein
VGLSAVIVDHNGRVCAQFDGDPVDMVDGEKSVMSDAGSLISARFWSVEDPYLYDVYTLLKVDGKVVDVNRLENGFPRPSSRAARARAAFTSTKSSSTSRDFPSGRPMNGLESAQAIPTGCTTTPPE